MKVIEISVLENDFERLKKFLNNLGFIKSIREKTSAKTDDITLLSEQSLAEDWDSEEDARYENCFS